MPNVSDDFNRADVSPLDGSWAGGYTGSNNLQIVGNEVRMASTAGGLDCIASHTTAQGNDQWSKATLVTFNDAGAQWIGEIVRLAAPTTFTGYGGGGLRNFGGNTSWIIEWTTGTPATLVAETATTWAATNNIVCAVRGTTLYVYRNGGVPLLTITDASNASGRIGQHCYSPALATAEIDNFLGGELPITFVSAGTEGSAASGNITPGIPASIAANDILIMAYHGSDQVAVTVDAAWTAAVTQANGGGTTSRMGVWWHRYDGVTPPSALITHTAGVTPIAGIAAFRGCKTSGSPINVAGTIAGGTDASMEHSTVTVTVDGCMLLAINGSADDNNRTLLSGWTNALEDSGAGTNNAFVSTAGNPDGSVSMFYVDSFIGATGTVTVTQAAADAWAAVLIALEPASSSLSATVNQIVETDLAQAVARLKAKAIGQNTETDLAQAVTRVKSKTLGQNTETDLAQTIAWTPKHRLVNQVIESDLSQAVARLKAKAVGQTLETDFAQEITRDTSVIVAVAQAAETDLSQAITRLKTKAVNQILETNLAQILTGLKTRSIAQITETNLAQALNRSKLKALGQISETDLAQAITELKTRGINQITETDLAQAIAHLKAKLLGQVAETDLAQAVTATGLKLINVAQVSETDLAQALLWNPKIRIVSQITETDLAQALTELKTKGINQITEIDLAQALTHLKTLAVNQIAETNLTQALTHAKLKAVGQITETDLAQAVARLKTRSVTQALENDLAQAIARLKAKAIGQTVETDLAQAVTVPGRLIVAVNQTTESDLAQAINWAPKIRSLGIAAEIDLAQFITGLKTGVIGMVSETSLAQSLTAAKAKEIAQALETDLAQSIAWNPKSRLLAQAFETDLAQIILYIPSQTVGNVWRFEAVVIGASKIILATIEGPILNGAVLATSKLINAEMAEVSDLAEATIAASKLTDAEFKE
jgi:hypothetical protein